MWRERKRLQAVASDIYAKWNRCGFCLDRYLRNELSWADFITVFPPILAVSAQVGILTDSAYQESFPRFVMQEPRFILLRNIELSLRPHCKKIMGPAEDTPVFSGKDNKSLSFASVDVAEITRTDSLH